jgi:hypothetical protein
MGVDWWLVSSRMLVDTREIFADEWASASGGATMKEPEGGFSNLGLAKMFDNMVGKRNGTSKNAAERLKVKLTSMILVAFSIWRVTSL